MRRAEERAKSYCKKKDYKSEWIKPYLAYIEGYEQAEKDFIEKAAKWLKSCLDNGCWVASNLCDYDKKGIIQGFREMMSE